jgi:hypothetical protein
MGPNNNETSGGLQLPAPQPESSPGAENEASAAERAAPAGVEQATGNVAPAQPIPSLSLPPMPATPSPLALQSDVPSTTPTGNLQASDDSDLIEKEWVNKAKEIVEKTRDDPYKQSEELTVVKADYIKKRYNKTIKLNK